MGYKRMALAAGVGYVLGAKAGEKRYEQLKDLWERASDSMSESPLLQSLREAGTRAAGRGMEAVRTRGQRSDNTNEEDSAEGEWEASDDQDEEAEEPEEGERGGEYEVSYDDEQGDEGEIAGQAEDEDEGENEDGDEEEDEKPRRLRAAEDRSAEDDEPDAGEEHDDRPRAHRDRPPARRAQPRRRAGRPRQDRRSREHRSRERGDERSSGGSGLGAATRRFLDAARERGRVA